MIEKCVIIKVCPVRTTTNLISMLFRFLLGVFLNYNVDVRYSGTHLFGTQNNKDYEKIKAPLSSSQSDIINQYLMFIFQFLIILISYIFFIKNFNI